MYPPIKCVLLLTLFTTIYNNTVLFGSSCHPTKSDKNFKKEYEKFLKKCHNNIVSNIKKLKPNATRVEGYTAVINKERIRAEDLGEQIACYKIERSTKFGGEFLTKRKKFYFWYIKSLYHKQQEGKNQTS